MYVTLYYIMYIDAPRGVIINPSITPKQEITESNRLALQMVKEKDAVIVSIYIYIIK